MLIRELKVNFKSFLIWTILLIVLFLVVFLIYPTMIAGEQMGAMDELLQMFPPEVLKAFNMDISGIDTAFGWMKTEGFVFVLLITGVYSGILGSNILLKEESDKTIEYLHSVVVTRSEILVKKVVVSFFYILTMIVTLCLFNFIFLQGNDDFEIKQFILLSITPVFSSTVLFSLCLFISTFARKTKKVLGLSLGVVFASYFLNMIAQMSEKTEFLKYLSVFTLADVRNVITKQEINLVLVIVTIVLCLIFCMMSLIRYNNKELTV